MWFSPRLAGGNVRWYAGWIFDLFYYILRVVNVEPGAVDDKTHSAELLIFQRLYFVTVCPRMAVCLLCSFRIGFKALRLPAKVWRYKQLGPYSDCGAGLN